MAIVAVTRTVMARPAYLVPFGRANLRVARQVRRTPGFIAGALGVSVGSVFWTMTMWQDGRAMVAFRDSGAHVDEMPKLAGWSKHGCFTAWQTEETTLPSWAEAHDRLTERAHFVPVTAPDENQRGHVVPATRGSVLSLPIRRARRPG